MNVWRAGHQATLLNDGTVLVTGGDRRYGPTMSDARSYHSATLLNDGSVLVAGGFNNSDTPSGITLRSAEIFDPIARAWTVTESMRLTRWRHSAVR